MLAIYCLGVLITLFIQEIMDSSYYANEAYMRVVYALIWPLTLVVVIIVYPLLLFVIGVASAVDYFVNGK